MKHNPLRSLPSVHSLLELEPLVDLIQVVGQDQVVEQIRIHLDKIRNNLRCETAEALDVSPAVLAKQIALDILSATRPILRKVINATGIVLHTNLGRSPMALEAATAAFEAAKGYLNLEVDIETGKRSSRQDAVRGWICKLLGAESSTVVNNCAAATIIALRALAKGREVIVSRGQLIEIGGSFRLPEIMEVSGAILREVGTTNITHLSDYQKAIGPNTAAILRVHPSNYRIHGFEEQPSLEDLVALAKSHNIPLIDDVGSGAVFPLNVPGYHEEPNPRISLAKGADLTLFSGDKLLGGPQSGIIAGAASWIQAIEKDPLMRAFRLDKMTLCALEQTVLLHLNPASVKERIPTLRMLSATEKELLQQAESLLQMLQPLAPEASITICSGAGFAGGGTLPTQEIPTWLIEIKSKMQSAESLAYALRTGEPSVFARIQEDKILLDMRTVASGELATLAQAVVQAMGH